MKISVVIPTFNRPDLLEKLLVSIKDQTLQVFEVIIINDNSKNKDVYDDVIIKYNEFFKIKYIFLNHNKGAQFCRNLGLLVAEGDYVCFTDDDDYWANTKIAKQLEIAKEKGSDLVFSWAKVVDESGAFIGSYEFNGNPEEIKKIILSGCVIPSPTVMVKRDFILDIGGFDESLESCQDWDMWIRMIHNDAQISCTMTYEAFYLKHNRGSIGLSNRALLGYAKIYKKHILKSRYNWRFLFSAFKFFIKRPKLIFILK